MSSSRATLEERIKTLRHLLPQTASERITGRSEYCQCPQCGSSLIVEEIYGPRVEEQWLECPGCRATLGLSQAYEAEIRLDQE